MEDLKFSGYDPKPVMESKLNKLIDVIKELQLEVAKLKLANESGKKAAKAVKETEE